MADSALYNDFISNKTDEVIELVGLKVTIDETTLNALESPGKNGEDRRKATRHLHVYADELTIEGRVSNPSGNIEINARKVIAGDGAWLDVSGYLPSDYLAEAKAPNADDNRATTAKGANGKAGDIGYLGGNVRITADTIVAKDGASGDAGIVRWGRRGEIAAAVEEAFADLRTLLDNRGLDLPEETVDINSPGVGSMGTFTVKEARLELRKAQFFTHFWYDKICQGEASLEYRNPVVTGELEIDAAGSSHVHRVQGTYHFEMNFGAMFHRLPFDVEPFGDVDIKEPTSQYFGLNGPERLTLTSSGPVGWIVDFFSSRFGDRARVEKYLDTARGDLVARIQGSIKSEFDRIFDKAKRDQRLAKRLTTKPHLLITAAGGRGQRGEDGNIGGTGKTGDDGKKEVPFSPYSVSEANGGKGGTGGEGGDGGKGGNGAQGGRIALDWTGSLGARVFIDVAGGSSGIPGVPGEGGLGGNGGRAGTFINTTTGDPKNPVGEFKAQNGEEGDRGNHGVAPAGALFGYGGKFLVNGRGYEDGELPKPISVSNFADTVNIDQLLMIQRAIRLSFLAASQADDYEYPVTVAEWLQPIAADLAGRRASRRTATVGKERRWYQSDPALARTIEDTCANVLDHFRRGLDFYGHYRNWAPVLALKYYQQRAADLTQLASVVENQLNEFQADKKDSDRRTKSLRTVAREIQKDVAKQENGVEGLRKRIGDLDRQIVDLTGQVHAQERVVLDAEEKFREGLEAYLRDKSSEECKLKDILKASIDIIQMGAAAHAGYVDVSGAYGKFRKAAEGMDQIKKGVAFLQKAEKGWKDVVKARDQIKKMLPKEKGGVDGRALIAMKREEFHKEMKAFKDKFPAASTFVAEVDTFFDLVDTLNQSSCAYTSLRIERDGAIREMEQRKAELSRYNDLMIDEQPDPNLPENTAFMRSVYENIKLALVKQLYEQLRAYEYRTLETYTGHFNDMNLAHIAIENIRSRVHFDEYLAKVKAPSQDFTEVIVIDEDKFPGVFANFAADRKFSFTLRPEQEPWFNRPQALVRTFTVSFPTLEGVSGQLEKGQSGRLEILLTHPGSSLQVRRDVRWSGAASDRNARMEEKYLRHFVHDPRTVSFSISYGESRNVAGGRIADDDTIVGLSPLTTWTLSLEGGINDFFVKHIDKIDKVEIEFTGIYENKY